MGTTCCSRCRHGIGRTLSYFSCALADWRTAFMKISLQNLASAFLRLVEKGEKGNFEFVLEVLERFDGAKEARPVYKAIVSKLPSEGPLLNTVGVGLDSTGFVAGEFGTAEAYKERRAAVAQWLEDADEKVRSFARKHVAQLDCMIACEQRRAEEDLELRKRSWGTDPNTA
jgi:hypothetical protein